MNLKSTLSSWLLMVVVQGHAQSLGAVQGAAIIGRPLDIVVQSLGAAEDGALSQCVQAEVRYGEMRLSPSDVDLTFEGDVAQAGGMLRVRTRLPVNEPFVTLEVRVGCPVRLTRAYTLLADMEPQLPVLPPTATGSDEASSFAPAPVTPKRPVARTPRPPGDAPRSPKAKPVAAPAPAARESGGTVRPTAPQASPTAGSRLELAPVDLAQSLGAPSGDEPTGGAVAGSPHTMAATAESDPQVQQELASLRAEQQRLLLAIESLNRELTAVRSARSDGILYALAGVIGVLLGAVLWLLRRPAAGAPLPTAPWWTTPEERRGGQTPAAPVSTSASDAQAEPQPATVADPPMAAIGSTRPRTGDRMTGLEVSEAEAAVFHEVPTALLDVAALRELWEQVDFFESLGQAADAVTPLRAFVLAHPRASEAPYLRWWALANKHGLETHSPQALYEQHYQRPLPVADMADGLESDEGLLQALTRDWPGDAARAILEAALASQPGDPAAPLQVRTLAAFDDLIVLHGVLHGRSVLGQAPAAPQTADAAPADGALDFDWSAWTPTSSDAPALR